MPTTWFGVGVQTLTEGLVVLSGHGGFAANARSENIETTTAINNAGVLQTLGILIMLRTMHFNLER
ncbi:MAG TPA: hypothetical protein VJX16_05125 [Terriglobales bacterium]|nr:hypothetical protein [Terriglobales bacterium]